MVYKMHLMLLVYTANNGNWKITQIKLK
jgi:hypothetical protein